jgi:hypothetical protein
LNLILARPEPAEADGERAAQLASGDRTQAETGDGRDLFTFRAFVEVAIARAENDVSCLTAATGIFDEQDLRAEIEWWVTFPPARFELRRTNR